MHAYEMHAHEVYPREMHARKAHARKAHAHETPAHHLLWWLSGPGFQNMSFGASCGWSLLPARSRRIRRA
jgi:hypothetical protein